MKLKNKNDKEAVSLLMNFPQNSRYAESFRTLRTNLNFAVLEKDFSSVLVTSSVEAEGKTNTVVNLGFTVAQTGKKVLLVDADLRRPRLTKLFALKSERGLTDVVSDSLRRGVSKGSLDEYSIGDLIKLIKLQNRTGELSLEDNDNKASLYFISGDLADIYWKNRPESKKLANVLVQNKLLTKEEAQTALGLQKKSDRRLGAVLFSMGMVSREKLTKILSVQTIEAMRVVSGMSHGSFEFLPLNREEIKSPVSQGVDFDKLISEFLGNGEELIFINKSIDAAVQPTDVDNLFVMPSGEIPPNPAEVIGSSATELVMDILKKKFDFIILDTPPVMPATDALIMAPRTDGTILVIKSGNTDKKIVKTVVDSFQSANLPILGILLNQVDMKKEGYYRYYKKYYASYYGSK